MAAGGGWKRFRSVRQSYGGCSRPGAPRVGSSRVPPPRPMLSFRTRLDRAVASAGAPLCVGLDPDPARLPVGFDASPPSVQAFCCAITDSTCEWAAAYKPNLAFFEALGAGGADALAAVCAHVRSTGRLLILDGKRGDIGNTGTRYATALYEQLDGDAATVAPYMGADSVTPFLAHAGRCAFVLVATSNAGGADFQRLLVDGEPLAHHVARRALAWARDTPGEVGFVVGATRPEALGTIRALAPDVPFLVPGVGAQGGSVAATLAANAGGPLLVSASRSVLYASSGPDFAQAAAQAAARLAAELRG